MKYVKQFFVICAFAFLGEILSWLIPLPIPSSIYGIILLFLALVSGVLKLEAVKETAHFLVEIMPVMFIAPGAALINSWGMIKSRLPAYLVILVVTTVAVMAVVGRVTQGLMKKGDK